MTHRVQRLMLVVAGWVSRQQPDVIDYLPEDNRVLPSQLKGKKLRPSDGDSRHREARGDHGNQQSNVGLYGAAWGSCARWGQAWSQHDEADRGGSRHCAGTKAEQRHAVGNIDQDARGRDSRNGLVHRRSAASFGLTRYHVMFIIDLATRRVCIGGITSDACSEWMTNLMRGMTDCFDGSLVGKRYLIHDRDPLFTEEGRGWLRWCGAEPVRLPAHSPNLNAYAERCVISVRTEFLNRIIQPSERHLRRIICRVEPNRT
jgi:hypothetical protein